MPRYESCDEIQLKRLAEALGQSTDSHGLVRALVGERAETNEIFLGHSTIGPVSQKAMSWQRFIGVLQLDHLAFLHAMRSVIESAENPSPGTPWATSLNIPPYAILSGILIPALEATENNDCRYRVVAQNAVVALAVKRYQQRHGKPPETLAELSPEFLPSPPIDLYDGQPLRMTVTENIITIYSIGEDRADNGGVKTNSSGMEFKPGSDILFAVPR